VPKINVKFIDNNKSDKKHLPKSSKSINLKLEISKNGIQKPNEAGGRFKNKENKSKDSSSSKDFIGATGERF
jgi:hypothetical protein